MNELLSYTKLYPNIPIEIILFFSEHDIKDNKLIPKEIFAFCCHYKRKHKLDQIPQPRVVSKICDILCENNQLSVIKKGGLDNGSSSYYCNLHDENIRTNEVLQFYYNKKLSYIIYGFKYIYDDYKKYVLPIEFTNHKDEKTLGTCFLYKGGIATAKHCIEEAQSISIQGVSMDALESAKFEIHENPLMDLLFIRLDTNLTDTARFSEEAELLDAVMTLGYPKIAGYHNFLTAENANVSARFTASTGQITSNAKDIWVKEKLFLISAKIKGGNSGGPVVNRRGSVVGVAVNMTQGDGNYDELGYGTVIPISFLDNLIDASNKNYLNVEKIKFKNFEE